MNAIAIKLRPYTSDGFIANEILTQDCYLSCLINQGDKVVDIGAHIGLFTALALTRTDKVVAFEPLKENCLLLRENAPGAEIREVAVSFDGTIENKKIRVRSFNRGGGDMNEIEGEKVACIRFDNLLGQKIDFLKIDIEGSEIGLLSHPEWLDKVKILALETHNNTFGRFYEFLFKCGFRFIKASAKEELGLFVAIKL
jgi:FkbM family methyltransferase